MEGSMGKLFTTQKLYKTNRVLVKQKLTKMNVKRYKVHLILSKYGKVTNNLKNYISTHKCVKSYVAWSSNQKAS